MWGASFDSLPSAERRVSCGLGCGKLLGMEEIEGDVSDRVDLGLIRRFRKLQDRCSRGGQSGSERRVLPRGLKYGEKVEML